MRVGFFVHSLVSDWNHGNAHFLRGVVTELSARGHEVRVFEPAGSWSLTNLIADAGEEAPRAAMAVYPAVTSEAYDLASVDLDALTAGLDLCIVHEWNDHELVKRVGELRKAGASFRLLFHDTHHRAVTDPGAMAAYDLSGFDGVLAFGEVLRRLYLERRWTTRAWTWHEAADARLFHAQHRRTIADDERGDLVWVGNWGDDERTQELAEFLLAPAKALRLSSTVYGVRYPEEAQQALRLAGVHYGGYLPNHRAPEVFARHRLTVHVPRRPYARALPGIPTIRVFEALACGIPLVSAPWDDVEELFTPGEDFLVAADGAEMERHLTTLLHEPARAAQMAEHGRSTILARHTCAHRVDELTSIARELGVRIASTSRAAPGAGAENVATTLPQARAHS